MPMYKHVMVAVDESDDALALATTAHELAHQYQCKLTLLHVLDQRSFMEGKDAGVPLYGFTLDTEALRSVDMASDLPDQPFNLDRRLVDQARRFLSVVSARLADPPAHVMIKASAAVGSAVVDAAVHHDADLLVLGAHHASFLDFLSASVVTNVVRHMPCDVLIVHQHQQGPHE